MIMILIEGLVACFLLLIPCVVGIANGPVSLVCLYEKEVQDRVVEKGLITRERINRNANYFRLFGILPFFIFVLVAVYGINGAHGFRDGFWQISVILLMEGLFDRLFIDWYWVGKTKAWIIPGTEDIPFVQTWPQVIKKRSILTLVWIIGAVIVAGIVILIFR